MRSIKPSDCLKSFVEAYIIVESHESLVNKLLPDTSVIMAFRFKGLVSAINNEKATDLPVFSVSGLRKTYRLVQYMGSSGNILVQFKVGAAAAFFPVPVHELFGASVSLADLFGQSFIRNLEDQMNSVNTVEGKIQLIEQFLISRLPGKQPDLLVDHAVRQIQAADGMLRMRPLAESLNISCDAFEKRFRKTVGSTPKQFASIVRIKSLISQGALKESLTHSAFSAGFFDQSHFIREFRKFTGQTPSDFFNLRHSGQR